MLATLVALHDISKKRFSLNDDERAYRDYKNSPELNPQANPYTLFIKRNSFSATAFTLANLTVATSIGRLFGPIGLAMSVSLSLLWSLSVVVAVTLWAEKSAKHADQNLATPPDNHGVSVPVRGRRELRRGVLWGLFLSLFFAGALVMGVFALPGVMLLGKTWATLLQAGIGCILGATDSSLALAIREGKKTPAFITGLMVMALGIAALLSLGVTNYFVLTIGMGLAISGGCAHTHLLTTHPKLANTLTLAIIGGFISTLLTLSMGYGIALLSCMAASGVLFGSMANLMAYLGSNIADTGIIEGEASKRLIKGIAGTMTLISLAGLAYSFTSLSTKPILAGLMLVACSTCAGIGIGLFLGVAFGVDYDLVSTSHSNPNFISEPKQRYEACEQLGIFASPARAMSRYPNILAHQGTRFEGTFSQQHQCYCGGQRPDIRRTR